MGKATNQMRDVLVGNLKGCEANVEATEAKIRELQDELERHVAERAEYRLMLAAHETHAADVRDAENLAVAEEVSSSA